jgi:nuclear pore complex protein Nup205
VHYFPAIAAYIARCGGQEGGVSIADARALNEKIFSSQALSQEGKDPWALPYVHAAFRAWWLAEYSSWYGEHYDGSLPQNQLEEG